METIGIIVEYNPFHNGHLYQIEQIKKQTGAKNIVVVMSGNYVQRGTPAWTDKFLRTEMALSCGVDMVFELPVAFATSSAEIFANAGVSLLTSLGFVDGICFGSECTDLTLLSKIADFLCEPTENFENEIRTFMATGITYPTARTRALIHFFEESSHIAEILNNPNTILAIEYLKALKSQNSPLTPFLLERVDHGYHNANPNGKYASASAIRSLFDQINKTPATNLSKENITVYRPEIATLMPENVCSLLEKNKTRYPITANDFSNLLYYRLLQLSDKDKTIADMTEEIFYRIQRRLSDFENYDCFITDIKTKQYTHSRISRVLLHLLLQIDDTYFRTFSNQKHISYSSEEKKDHIIEFPIVPTARLLGFRKEKSSLLRQCTNMPIITKPADGLHQIESFYQKKLEELQSRKAKQEVRAHNNFKENLLMQLDYAKKLYQQDIFASNLYYQIQSAKLNENPINELRRSPIIYA